MESNTSSNGNPNEMKNMSFSTQRHVNDGLAGNLFFDLLNLGTRLFDYNIRGMGRLAQPSRRVLESSQCDPFHKDTTSEDSHFRLSSPKFGFQPLIMSTQQNSKGTHTTCTKIVPCFTDQRENEGTKKQTDDVPNPTQLRQNELFPSLCMQIREKLKEASKKLKEHQVDSNESKGELDEQGIGQSQFKVVAQVESKNSDGVQPQSIIQSEAAQSEFKSGALMPIPRSFCALTVTVNGPPTGTNDESTGVPTKKTRTKTLYAGELPLHFKLLPGYGYIAQKVDENVALQLVPSDKSSSILPRLPFSRRLQNWMIKRRQRADRRYDLYYYHKESNVTFRSTLEVSDFIVYSVYPSTMNVTRKRKTRAEPQEREVGTEGKISSNKEGRAPGHVDGDVESEVKETPHKLYWDGQARMIECEIGSIDGDDICFSSPEENKRSRDQKSGRQKKNGHAPSTPSGSTSHNFENTNVTDCCNNLFKDFNDVDDSVQVAVNVLNSHFSA